MQRRSLPLPGNHPLNDCTQVPCQQLYHLTPICTAIACLARPTLPGSGVDKEVSSDFFGAFRHGHGRRHLDYAETRARDLIVSGRMVQKKAPHLVDPIDASTPFYTRPAYIEALAALAAVFTKDMNKRVTGASQRICHILSCSCSRTAGMVVE